jgi:hypothetical protein
MKETLKVAAAIIILAAVFVSVKGYNIVIPVSQSGDCLPVFKSKSGDTVSVFSKFDFTKDDWVAYIVIPSSDYVDLNSQIPHRTCLKTTDRNLLQKMKHEWRFKITQGDVATVESVFYLLKNGKTVFRSGIVLDTYSQVLQNSVYGEMVPIDKNAMINTCREFRNVYWPVVVF